MKLLVLFFGILIVSVFSGVHSQTSPNIMCSKKGTKDFVCNASTTSSDVAVKQRVKDLNDEFARVEAFCKKTVSKESMFSTQIAVPNSQWLSVGRIKKTQANQTYISKIITRQIDASKIGANLQKDAKLQAMVRYYLEPGFSGIVFLFLTLLFAIFFFCARCCCYQKGVCSCPCICFTLDLPCCCSCCFCCNTTMNDKQKESGLCSLYKFWPLAIYLVFALLAYVFAGLGLTAIGKLGSSASDMLCKTRGFGAESTYWIGDQIGQPIQDVFTGFQSSATNVGTTASTELSAITGTLTQFTTCINRVRSNFTTTMKDETAAQIMSSLYHLLGNATQKVDQQIVPLQAIPQSIEDAFTSQKATLQKTSEDLDKMVTGGQAQLANMLVVPTNAIVMQARQYLTLVPTFGIVFFVLTFLSVILTLTSVAVSYTAKATTNVDESHDDAEDEEESCAASVMQGLSQALVTFAWNLAIWGSAILFLLSIPTLIVSQVMMDTCSILDDAPNNMGYYFNVSQLTAGGSSRQLFDMYAKRELVGVNTANVNPLAVIEGCFTDVPIFTSLGIANGLGNLTNKIKFNGLGGSIGTVDFSDTLGALRKGLYDRRLKNLTQTATVGGTTVTLNCPAGHCCDFTNQNYVDCSAGMDNVIQALAQCWNGPYNDAYGPQFNVSGTANPLPADTAAGKINSQIQSSVATLSQTEQFFKPLFDALDTLKVSGNCSFIATTYRGLQGVACDDFLMNFVEFGVCMIFVGVWGIFLAIFNVFINNRINNKGYVNDEKAGRNAKPVTRKQSTEISMTPL